VLASTFVRTTKAKENRKGPTWKTYATERN